MAKAAKREPLSLDRIGIPPRVSNALLGVFGVLAIGLSLLLIWQSYQAWSRTRIEPQLDALRGQVANRIAEDAKALRDRLDAALGDPHVRADLAASEFDDAAARVSSGWSEATAVEFFDPSLESAYSEGLSQFGFAKLALLSAAQTRDQTVSDVVGGAEAPTLGLAAPVHTDAGTVALAFVSLPLTSITAAITSARMPGGYLELRSGPRVLDSHGDATLKAQGTSTPVPDLTLQVATAAPLARTVLAYPPLVQGGIALLAMLLGGVLLFRLRRALGSGKIVGVEPTFGEVLQQKGDGSEAAPRAPAKPVAKPVEHNVERSIFRAYDIRGVVGQTLDEGVARLIGQAVGTLMRSKDLREIVVGRDGRLSGPSLSNALIEGLRRTGCDVIDIGQAPTPLLYFANFQLNTGSGIAVTGSHNPPDYNGFKIVVGGETLSGDAIRDLYVSIAENRLQEDEIGGLQVLDVSADYIERVSGDIQLERRLKVVVDAGNGVAGELGPAVLEAIGAEVIPLHCDIDGEFPNHHPDPSDPANLADLITFVKKFDADLGIAFDGDGDRLGVVSREGEIIYPDRVLMLFAQDVLARNPGASVIYDVKCTSHLAGQILRHGGSPIMWKTGHSLIKAKMKETEAELAGEMSGHFFFRERWYGFDDAIYSASRLLEILAASESSPEEIFAELPKGVSTPELKITMAEGENYAFMEKFREQAKFEGAKIATIDGIRADWPDGWGLVRCSNTTPSLVLRFDAESQEALIRVQDVFRAQLLALDSGLSLPF